MYLFVFKFPNIFEMCYIVKSSGGTSKKKILFKKNFLKGKYKQLKIENLKKSRHSIHVLKNKRMDCLQTA